MKWRNHNNDNGLYFVTIVLRKFIPLFVDDKVVDIVFDSLNYLRKNKDLKVYAYVVMPDHIHFVAGVDLGAQSGLAAKRDQSMNMDSEFHFFALVGQFKSYTSRRIAEHLISTKSRYLETIKVLAYKGQNYAVWQETFRSVNIADNKTLSQKINYIHGNPVKRALVKDPADWKYSSFKQIELGEGAPVFLVDLLV